MKRTCPRFLCFSFALLAGCAAWSGDSVYRDQILADGPISYWRLGESSATSTALDELGNNSGSYGSLAALGQAGAVVFDPDTALGVLGGATSKVTIAPSSTLTPSQFTIELWARLTGSPGAGRSPAAYRDLVSPSNISGWQIAVNSAGNWEFRIGRGNVGAGDAWNTIEASAAELDQWTYVVGSFEGGSMRLYLDGELAGELTDVSYLPVDSFFFFINFFIGASVTEDVSGTGGAFWLGDVDEVAFYARALSETEVGQHYALATDPSPEPTLTAITGVDKQRGDVQFRWQSELGGVYQLQRSDDRSNWANVGASQSGSGGELSESDSLGAGGALEFYRVEVAGLSD